MRSLWESGLLEELEFVVQPLLSHLRLVAAVEDLVDLQGIAKSRFGGGIERSFSGVDGFRAPVEEEERVGLAAILPDVLSPSIVVSSKEAGLDTNDMKKRRKRSDCKQRDVHEGYEARRGVVQVLDDILPSSILLQLLQLYLKLGFVHFHCKSHTSPAHNTQYSESADTIQDPRIVAIVSILPPRFG